MSNPNYTLLICVAPPSAEQGADKEFSFRAEPISIPRSSPRAVPIPVPMLSVEILIFLIYINRRVNFVVGAFALLV